MTTPRPLAFPPWTLDERAIRLLALSLGWAAQRAGARLALAESCTGGLASSWLTRIGGSSQWFEGGVVSYSNEVKIHQLQVPSALLKNHGAVSEPVAKAMAQGLGQLAGPSTRGSPLSEALVSAPFITAAITGVAGPTGGSKEKPVGLVWFAWAEFDGQPPQGLPTRLWLDCQTFTGSREAIQQQAAWHALSRLLGHLLGRPTRV
jgi:nicotinamide-nucleotide amidase